MQPLKGNWSLDEDRSSKIKFSHQGRDEQHTYTYTTLPEERKGLFARGLKGPFAKDQPLTRDDVVSLVDQLNKKYKEGFSDPKDITLANGKRFKIERVGDESTNIKTAKVENQVLSSYIQKPLDEIKAQLANDFVDHETKEKLVTLQQKINEVVKDDSAREKDLVGLATKVVGLAPKITLIRDRFFKGPDAESARRVGGGGLKGEFDDTLSFILENIDNEDKVKEAAETLTRLETIANKLLVALSTEGSYNWNTGEFELGLGFEEDKERITDILSFEGKATPPKLPTTISFLKHALDLKIVVRELGLGQDTHKEVDEIIKQMRTNKAFAKILKNPEVKKLLDDIDTIK